MLVRFYIFCYNIVMNTYEFMKSTGELTYRSQQNYIDFAKAHGVNYNTLAVLYTSYINDGCTQMQVTNEWYVPKQTVNTICKNLIAEGIISKTKSDRDHRESCISLTEKGKKFAGPIVEKLLKIESGAVAMMGEENVLKFFEAYKKFNDILDAEFRKASH